MTSEIILASESPRRKELLGGLGLTFKIVVSGVPENQREGETPEEHVLRLAREKALAVSQGHPRSIVIGADTIVVIDGELLGKPENTPQARNMLQKLSGRTHEVITGFAMVRSGDVMINQSVSSRVLFKKLSDEELDWYIQTKEPYDKAGAYAVQGMGAFFIKEIHGSYTNVIGLPLSEVVDAMKQIAAFQFKELKIENT